MDSTLLTTGRLVGPVKREFNSKISMDSASPSSQPKKRGRPKGSKTKEDRESGTKGVAVKMRGGGAGDKKVSVDEKYTQWKNLFPVLYDWLTNHNPSMAFSLLLLEGKDISFEIFYLSENLNEYDDYTFWVQRDDQGYTHDKLQALPDVLDHSCGIK